MAGVILNNQREGVNIESSGEFSITPSDGADLAQYATGFYVTTTGDIHYTTTGGDEITKAVIANTYHPIHIKKVFDTGTDMLAGEIIGQY